MTGYDPFARQRPLAGDGPTPRESGSPATVIDLADPPAGRTSAPQLRREPDDSDAHLLRLCLDLQLDAMLLTLGAASAAPGTHEQGQVPWRRWVTEDVDLACTLASDARTGRAALPPTLGSDLHHAVPATTIDNLTARYESMRDLLADLVAAAGDDPAPGQPSDPGDTWRPRVREALERCERRLAELHAYRLATTPPRGIQLPEEHHYLPGELLG